jgi:threonine dehydrogenase-like Zn-dependent dehydrogenase
VKSLVYVANHRVEIQERPVPEPGPGEALLKVAAAGICGSDVDGFLGRSRKRIPPLVMGHEFSGTLVQDRDDGSLKAGQRVSVLPLRGCGACGYCASGRTNMCPGRVLIGMDVPGAFAEYVTAPRDALYPLPDKVSEAEAVFAEPLANGIHLSRLLPSPTPESALVLGSGTIGLLAIAVLKRAGVRTIVATDTNAARLGVAREMGAAAGVLASRPDTVSQIEETMGKAPLIIDCIGRGETRALGIQAAAPGALIVWIGQYDGEMAGEARDVTTKELTIKGSYGYTRDDFEQSLMMIGDEPATFRRLVTLEPLEKGQHIFEMLVSNPGGTVKVALVP